MKARSRQAFLLKKSLRKSSSSSWGLARKKEKSTSR